MLRRGIDNITKATHIYPDTKRDPIIRYALLCTLYESGVLNYTIAKELLGFKSAPSLFRLFQKQLGITPIAYKEKHMNTR